MHVRHLSNSFIIVTTEDAVVVCDPWVGHANHGGWQSFPEYDLNMLFRLVANATHVYISHLHSDHLDKNFLITSGLINKVFLIKKFKIPILRNRLKSFGANQIREVDDFSDYKISSTTSISIIPQFHSTSDALEDPVDFDLDTSIIVHDGKQTFFNQVDNPLAVGDFLHVKSYINFTYGGLDLACFQCGAASEYPQCFIGIDREIEKEKVIQASLAKLAKAIELMAPRALFIAGGAYVIPGKFSKLNKFIAQPDNSQIQRVIPNNITYFSSGSCIAIDGQKCTEVTNIKPVIDKVSDSILFHLNDSYDYQSLELPGLDKVKELFDLAKNNFYSVLEFKNIELRSEIDFYLYEDLRFDEDLNILHDSIIELNLYSQESSKASQNHQIYLDIRAFYGALTKQLVWNQVLSGSLCLFKREPNIHFPEVLFALNFLVADRHYEPQCP